MATDIGEFLVGAYLKQVLQCDFVDDNVRPLERGRAGQAEFDVVGFDFKNETAYVCEVATHLDGVLYGDGNKDTVEKIRQKHDRQRAYAEKYLSNFKQLRFMFWSPRMPEGYITRELATVTTLELFVNASYAACVDELRVLAKQESRDVGNPFFRSLQILESLKR